MKNIAIFASGTGSNARKIVEYFDHHPSVNVGLIVSNKEKALVLNLAKEYNIPHLVINRNYFYHSTQILEKCNALQIDFIVLAGFLWLIPGYFIQAFENRMVNIHPALLPKYGGKGMYGMHVHRAVKAANEKESGITIHLVNEKYDDGAIVFQAKCPLDTDDTPNDIAKKVLQLEHKHFAQVIEQLLA